MFSLINIRLSAVYLLITTCLTVWSVDLSEANVDNDTVLAAPWLYPALPIIALGSTNEKCRDDSQRVLDNLRNATMWAVQMLDASAQSVEGLLMGHVNQLGNFAECLWKKTPVPRQYCLAEVTLKHPASMKYNPNTGPYNPYGSAWDTISYVDRSKMRRNLVHHALCVPSSCSHQDIQASIDRHLAESPRNNSISVKVSAALCQKSKSGEVFSTGSLIYCIVLGAIVVVVSLSTLYDVRSSDEDLNKNGNQQGNPYLLCFSLKKNFSNLINNPTPNNINCIYGLKAISVCCVIFNHEHFFLAASPSINYETFENMYSTWFIGILNQSALLVDSFLLLSGILVTYILMLALNKRSINPFLVILLRYIRLTPAYAIVVFFYATVMYHVGDGPYWPTSMGAEREFCRQNWWTNLLYVSNYVNDKQMCTIHSWYLPCDFHYFVVAVFLVPLIHKLPMTGYFVLALTTFASMAVQVVVSYVTHQDPVQFYYQDMLQSSRTQQFFNTMYIKSHNHATPYLVGMLIGLILVRCKPHHHKYMWQATLVQLTGLLVCAASLVPGYFIITKTMEYGPLMSALEQPQRRFFFPLGLGLFAIGLTLSKTSVIDQLLSSRLAVVTSRLSYSAYLVSFPMQQINTAKLKTSINDNFIDSTITGISDIVLSFAVALALYLTVEAPCGNITDEFVRKERKETSPKEDTP